MSLQFGIFPKFLGLTFRGKFLEISRPFATLLHDVMSQKLSLMACVHLDTIFLKSVFFFFSKQWWDIFTSVISLIVVLSTMLDE